MNLLQFSRLALSVLLCGFFTKALSQTEKTNHPFSWKETTDQWYMPQGYAFKFLSDDLTAKGGNAPSSTKPTASVSWARRCV
jgi:hypothetical protein